MKVLFLCALFVAAAFAVEGAHELCGLNSDQIKTMLKCMGERIESAELKEKAKGIIYSQGDNLAEVLKKQCDAELDFGEVLKAIFSAEEAEAIRKAYSECKPGQS